MTKGYQVRIDTAQNFINDKNHPIESLCCDVVKYVFESIQKYHFNHPEEILSINHFQLTSAIVTNVIVNLIDSLISPRDPTERIKIFNKWADVFIVDLKDSWEKIETHKANANKEVN